MIKPGRTAILLATYNGVYFLDEQLSSLADQTMPRIDIWASDDGSTDGTVRILTDWAAHWPKGSFKVLAGPNKGFAENFRSLLTNDKIDADYYAYCDQDDIWDHDKLESAITWLASGDAVQPRVYCSRTRLVDPKGLAIGHSPLFGKPPSFRNALVQSIAGGNTMVLNRAARDLVAEASARRGFVSHDWWTYLVVSGAGGSVHYAAEPHLSYRQHEGNLIGENNSWRSRIKRLRMLMEGRFAAWSEQNISGLTACIDLLDDEAIGILKEFEAARSAHVAARLFHLKRSGVYRQTLLGQLGLHFACLIRRI